jgi:hypothetical protein
VAEPQRQAEISPVNFPVLAVVGSPTPAPPNASSPPAGPPVPTAPTGPSPDALNSFSNVAKPNSSYHFPSLGPASLEPSQPSEPAPATWPRAALPLPKSGGKKGKKKGKVVLLSTGGNRGSH